MLVKAGGRDYLGLFLQAKSVAEKLYWRYASRSLFFQSKYIIIDLLI